MIVFETLSKNTQTATSTTITVSAPVGIVEGDLLLAFWHIDNGTTVLTNPADWQTISSQERSSTRSRALYKVATDSEPAEYVFTQSLSAPDQSVIILRYSGASYDSAAGWNSAVISHNFSIPEKVVSIENAVVVRWTGVNDDGDGGTINSSVSASDHTRRDLTKAFNFGHVTFEIAVASPTTVPSISVATESLDGGTVDYATGYNVILATIEEEVISKPLLLLCL